MDTTELDLPGFRFHPTEEELLEFYLKKMVLGKKLRCDIIGFLNIYQHDPWDLPGLAKIGEREWYFFVRRDRKHGNGGRPNRTTQHGFWKATGSDRPIRRLSDPKRILGLRKTLVFYKGRAPRGSKTDWVMNEYRMPQSSSSPEEDIVLCKIYRKATSLKVLEQRAAMEEETNISHMASSFPMTTLDGVQQETYLEPISMPTYEIFPKTEHEEEEEEVEKRKDDVAMQKGSACSSSSNLPHLQVPQFNLDWMQDPFLTQLRSPWMDNWTPYTNLLNI